MIARVLFACALIGAVFVGLGFGTGFFPRENRRGVKVISGIHPEREFSTVEFKSFAIILYAQNDADWCERSLRSIFEQDYESFRLLFIDDGSRDGTFEKVQSFIVENQQEHRAIVIRNDFAVGWIPSLYRAAQHCLDREIILPLSARDWLAGPRTLLSWNRAFQNPDAWIAFGRAIRYPSYDFFDPPKWDMENVEKKGYSDLELSPAHCFYSALFKQISIRHLFGNSSDYLLPLLELSGGRVKSLWDPVAFLNEATSKQKAPVPKPTGKCLSALSQFPKSADGERQEADVVIFSSNRPVQLYAAIESIQQNVAGYRRIAIVYWADADSTHAYEQMQSAFPQIEFLQQGKEHKRSLFKSIFDSPAEYILLSSDESLTKEPFDLRSCTEMLRKTGADGFSLQLTQANNTMPLICNMLALNPSDNEIPAALEMNLYRKSDLKSFFKRVRYEDFKDLQAAWKESFSKGSIYLTFDQPKAMEIPALLAKEELLSKFDQGLKVDLEPLYRGENPEFIPR